MQKNNQNGSKRHLAHLCMGAGGLYFSYIVLSIFLQKLYSTQYQSALSFNKDGTPVQNKFTYANLLVWSSAITCTIFGQIRRCVTKQRPNPISTKQGFILGLLFTLGMVGGNFSLLYVSFPTYSIGNNSKYLFVVLIGAFISRVPHHDNLKLPRHKLYVALLLTLGVILFNVVKFSESGSAQQNSKYPEEWKGYLLIVGSVIADAMFCDSQAYCKYAFKPTANHLFISANLWSFVMSVVFDIISGTFIPGIEFILEHPQCLKQLAIISVLQVTGQISIYYIISNFKQHIFPLISTTRKIITIVCSIIIFNHTLVSLQWLAVGIVFLGMIIQIYEQVTDKKKQKTKQIDLTESTKQTDSSNGKISLGNTSDDQNDDEQKTLEA